MPLRSSVPTHQFRANFARIPVQILQDPAWGANALTDESSNVLVDDLGQTLIE